MTTAMPSWVLDALDDNERRKLILSYRLVPAEARPLSVRTWKKSSSGRSRTRNCSWPGSPSAMTAFHDGQASRDARPPTKRHWIACRPWRNPGPH